MGDQHDEQGAEGGEGDRAGQEGGRHATLIYALPGAEAPKEFKTKDGQQLFVLKSLTKGDKGKEPVKP